MPTQKQITVFLENKPGRLAQLLSELARQKINVVALAVMDRNDQGVLRLVTEDPAATIAAIKGLNEVREGQDKDAIKAALEKLQQSSYKVAEEMYKATGGAPGSEATPPPGADAGAAPGSSAKPKDDVVDAEFRQS